MDVAPPSHHHHVNWTCQRPEALTPSSETSSVFTIPLHIARELERVWTETRCSTSAEANMSRELISVDAFPIPPRPDEVNSDEVALSFPCEFDVVKMHVAILFPKTTSVTTTENKWPIYRMMREASSYTLAVYSTFMGVGSNIAFVVPKTVPGYPCYMVSNNTEFLRQCAGKGWEPIFISSYAPPTPDEIVSATQAKFVKVTPEALPQLRGYDFLYYIDTKVDLAAAAERIPHHMSEMLRTNSPVGIRHHPFLGHSVWNEYRECLGQARYARQQGNMLSFINQRLSVGDKAEGEGMHLYWTSAILRNMNHSDILHLNRRWAAYVRTCGIECQISFFFVAQSFPNIYLLPQSL
eukprot:PhM_4_TR11451/c0_g1_i1/m.85410